jgi:HAD superfamily hydrolase (TIGR01509 family)
MLKNIIFDLGNVLISFKPAEYFDNLGYTAETRQAILNDIFRSKEWLLLDNGDITTAEAIERISHRSSLKYEEIASVFNLRRDIMYPINGNTKLLPELKKRGFRLYYLSNFPADIFEDVFHRFEFFRNFDGGIISSYVKCSKPDKRIFEILLEKYSLRAAECLFIDDLEINIQGAASAGIPGMFLTNPEELSAMMENELTKA